jgi:hypothetical protein
LGEWKRIGPTPRKKNRGVPPRVNRDSMGYILFFVSADDKEGTITEFEQIVEFTKKVGEFSSALKAKGQVEARE